MLLYTGENLECVGIVELLKQKSSEEWQDALIVMFKNELYYLGIEHCCTCLQVMYIKVSSITDLRKSAPIKPCRKIDGQRFLKQIFFPQIAEKLDVIHLFVRDYASVHDQWWW